MFKSYFFTLLQVLLIAGSCEPILAQDVQRTLPLSWNGVVSGGRFMDRFEAMPQGILRADVWGSAQVIPRFVDNGIEDDERSYWGGNVIYDAPSGQYHLFVCAWPEDHPKGHQAWPKSEVFQAISPCLYGPYRVIRKVGEGHNPELFRLKDGSFGLFAMVNWKPYYYHALTLQGDWKRNDFASFPRDRQVIDGMSNLTFTQREDGSMLMICRGGGVWISRDGVDTYHQVSNESVYPKRVAAFEDPVVWRDEVQYHLIVNDWLGRIAYYLRSGNGVDWVEDAGEGYTPGIARHADGKVEDWYKFERIKVFQDARGRAVMANFAVNDTLKKEDKGNDRHSSKNICLPLNKGMLCHVTEKRLKTPKMATLEVCIEGESDFIPQERLDLSTLRFGRPHDVDFGKGCEVLSSRRKGNDLYVTFSTFGYDIADTEFALKLMGKEQSGTLAYGYARNPNYDPQAPILSTLKPIKQGGEWQVEVTNFGLSSAPGSTLTLALSGGAQVRQVKVPRLAPYQSVMVSLGSLALDTQRLYQIRIQGKGIVHQAFDFKLDQ